ncbi:MAG: BamA/TamA family outer membrane protein [Chitinophagaceae bacterium]|nr:BamA/TamA family outer membrane protein [Chitinophagaceae bacterium]
MKQYFLLITWLVVAGSRVGAQTDTISQRIVLIGDAGQLTNGRHPVVDAVRNNIPLDSKTIVLFLGDNLYKHGLPDEQYKNYAQSRAVLDSQVSIADGTPSKVYMIPGNHDWENGSRGGYNAILRQQLYVDFLGKKNVKYFPEDGCPGPVEVPVGKDVVLILFDSQWWLHPFDKPEIESDCKCKTKEELVDQIADIAARNAKKLVLLACHHPFKSNGIHGGFFTLKQHLFPLTDLKKSLYIPMPVLGSIYPIARSVFGTPQDISHPNYTNMISQITDAVRRSSPNVVFVSGHDHNLQLIRENGYNYIVSGGGCKQGRTSNNKNSLFNSRSEGFVVMEVSTNKSVNATFYTVLDTVKKYNSIPLFNFTKLDPTFIDSSSKAAIDTNFTYPDSVSASISKELLPVKGLKKYFMGNNYRKEWSAPVSMRIFNLRREKGGFTIDGLGGSTQTKSLRLKNRATGEEWVLRSMNKSPINTIPEAFRGAVVKDIATELKTSTFPYGAFITPGLTDALGLASAKPELFFIPDDPALEFYRPLFANTVCMLEKRNASFDNSKTLTTAKLVDKMLEENDHRPQQQEVLKARLLDMLIADYDRHLDQWRWGSIDTGKGKIYYPIPRDRDQSFFYSNGRLLRFISGRSMPFLKGFREDINGVNWLNYIARDFDRIFLTDLDQEDWEKTLSRLTTELSDSVIRKAVKQLPPEIYALHGDRIAQKLIKRRDALSIAAMKYYRFISKQVNIIGSNQKEYFRVSSIGDKLEVRVFAKSRKSDTSFVMFNRVFDPKVTREIRLFGLHDEDVFDVDPKASSRIKLRIIGGRGIDTFNIRGKVEALLYDLKDDGGGGDYFVKDSSHAKKRFSNDPPVNDKSILGFNYNYSRFPQVHLNYNSDDGLLLGAGFSRRTFGFRNLPYATDQRLTALYAVDRRAIRLQYRGEFNHITRNLDLLIRANYSTPTLHNFFGLGNNSRYDEQQPRRYYQALFNYFEAEIMFRKRYFDKLHLMIGPYYSHYTASPSKNANTVLGKAAQVGLNQEDVFRKKTYAGVKAALTLDNRNKEFFPTRGMYWKHELLLTSKISSGEGKYVAYSNDMALYASLREPAKLVMVMKFGGGRIFSKNFEYFQAMSIGAQNDLPGFRKNRYAGKSSMYGGLEMRMQLFHLNSYIMPGPVGLSAFYNMGKVWLPGDRNGSKKWHGAYGLGLYYLPFNMFSISAYAGFDEGVKMFNFGLGTKFNLTY